MIIKIREAFVTHENFEELFSLIEKTLLGDRNALIFIQNQIYHDLCEKAYVGANDDGSYKFTIVGNYILIETFSSSQTFALASFTDDLSFNVDDRGDFKQLEEFRSPKIRYGMHGVKIGFKTCLFIQYKTDN